MIVDKRCCGRAAQPAGGATIFERRTSPRVEREVLRL